MCKSLICIVKKAILLLLLVAFTGVLSSHNNRPGSGKLISGKVIDKQTGEALAGVKVHIKGTDTYCYSDLDGNFSILVSNKPSTEISIDLVGYAPLTLKAIETGFEADLQLSPR